MGPFPPGPKFQNAITASHDGTAISASSTGCAIAKLMLVVSAQSVESLIPAQTKEQADVPSWIWRILSSTGRHQKPAHCVARTRSASMGSSQVTFLS